MSPLARALEGDPYANETPAQRDARMAWWREAKFGMFIHWGVYAVPAGTYDGKQIGGIGEWIMLQRQDPGGRLPGVCQGFQPGEIRSRGLGRARQGSRHALHGDHLETSRRLRLVSDRSQQVEHRGCHSMEKGSDRPARRGRAGAGLEVRTLLFPGPGLDQSRRRQSRLSRTARAGTTRTRAASIDYLDQIAVPQVREILTRYQPDVLWWDTPHLMTQPRAEKLAEAAPAQTRHHPQQPPRRRLQGRHRDPRAAHPGHRISRPRLGDLHDDERHLGLQELRPQLETALHPDHQPGGHRQQGRQLPAQRRPHRRRRDPRRSPSSCSRKSAHG